MQNIEVQEIQGLYGPFSLSERVLQKVWLRGDFDRTSLKTVSGKSLKVVHPGRWNLLEGPDFLEARLVLDGQEVIGDVEVHFSTSDWELHGHSDNPNFSKVRLHVVLYPEETPTLIQTHNAHVPELLYLLPLLDRDLEEYAIDDAIMELEQVEDAEWMLQFIAKPLDERRRVLRDGALSRWQVKCDFARKRLAGSSWSEACHQYCLEVLGYSRNRAPMSQIALNCSLEDFTKDRVDIEAIYEDHKDQWKLSGLRPANQPKRRLQQYREICEASPEWPERLRDLLQTFEPSEAVSNGATFRKAHDVPRKLERISRILGDKISAKRLNTLVCDAFLPLAETATLSELSEYWINWPTGDSPDSVYRFLKSAEVVERANPYSNGHLQGALQLLLNA